MIIHLLYKKKVDPTKILNDKESTLQFLVTSFTKLVKSNKNKPRPAIPYARNIKNYLYIITIVLKHGGCKDDILPCLFMLTSDHINRFTNTIILSQHKELFLLLVEYCPNINEAVNDETLLTKVCFRYGMVNNSRELISKIIKKSDTIHYKEQSGNTALSYLASNTFYNNINSIKEDDNNKQVNRNQSIQLLIDNGADIYHCLARLRPDVASIDTYKYMFSQHIINITPNENIMDEDEKEQEDVKIKKYETKMDNFIKTVTKQVRTYIINTLFKIKQDDNKRLDARNTLKIALGRSQTNNISGQILSYI
jgi:hypothetical protein